MPARASGYFCVSIPVLIMRKKRRLFLLVIIAVVSAIYLLQTYGPQEKPEALSDYTSLVYTKHATCRMACRQIDEDEIREIIANGRINQAKSGYDKKHKNETYVLEGYSKQNQHIRVVVTPKRRELLVITVIDLDRDWACDCD